MEQNKEKMNQIIGDSYKSFMVNHGFKETELGWEGKMHGSNQDVSGWLTKQEFINKCKTDPEFSERWELKIEERVLGLDERINLIEDDKDDKIIILFCENPADEWLKGQVNEILTHRKIPTKLITITYKNEIIEIYE